VAMRLLLNMAGGLSCVALAAWADRLLVSAKTTREHVGAGMAYVALVSALWAFWYLSQWPMSNALLHVRNLH
jgi:hypothetical protein